MLLRLPRSVRYTLPALGASGVMLLAAGCGVDSSIPVTSPSANLSGVIHGGPNPVIGATVRLYATTSATASYGAAATLLATATSNQFGAFTFNGTAYTCPAGQYVYATAAGGNTGGNTTNANSLLMAVVGACSSGTALPVVGSTTAIYISEATTVAASYALSNFITVSGSGAATRVDVSSSKNNNVTSPACTGTGSTLTCTAAGLLHAFQNALNLADTTGANSASPFYTVPPSNTGGLVPQTLLNTIADIVQSCINSPGGTAGDTSSCGVLFTNTTPPTTSTTTGVTPTNTVQALVNLAKYPTMTPTQVTALYGLVSSTAFFQPELATAPNDFSVAIVYKGAGSTTLGYPYFLTLDYADNVYSADNTTSSAGPVSVTSLASNGAPQFVGANITTALCSASSACLLAVGLDAHVWLPNYNTTSNRNVYEISTTDGSVTNTFNLGTTATPYAAAVDRFNSIFVSSSTAATANLFQSTAGSSGITFGNVSAGGATVTETLAPEELAFDSTGSLWNINYTSTSTGTSYFANSGTTATTLSAAVTSSESTTTAPYSIMIDGSNNGWVNSTKTLYEVAAGGTTPTASYTISYTAPGATTATTASSARYGALDGQGSIFLPDNNSTSSKLWQFFPGTTNFVYLVPCSTASGATACGTTSTTLALYGPRNAQADSTGSIWVESSTSGAIVQIIGTGNPTYPLLALGKPGVRP